VHGRNPRTISRIRADSSARKEEPDAADADAFATMARKREGLPAFLVFLSVLSLIIASIDVLPVASVSSLAPGLGSRVVAQNTGQIMDICVVDDTRALLVAKRGEVQLWTNGTLTTALALAAIRPVFVLHEMGLLSCLVDGPDLWLFYSTPGEQVVSRWIFNGSVVDEGSERVLFTIPINPKPPHMHAGSAMVFSSDKRHIYIATGDGMNCGTCIDVQNVTSYIGKVLRVDRDGQGVPRNPFWNGNGTSVQSRVFAKGFRNPWTMIPAPGSEDVLVFDVGRQGAESVKRVGAGTQGGWPCFEGRLRRRGFENLCLPALRNTTVLHQWLHNGRGSAIIGAAILPRAAFRSRFAGKVVFADYVRGGVFLADRSFKSVVQVASYAHGTSRIKVGPAGRLWLLRNFRKQVHEIYDETIQPPPYETDQPVSNCPVPTERGTVPSITNSSLLALTWATDREIGWKCERNDGIVGMPCAVDGRLLPGVTNGDSRPMTVDNRRYSFGFGVRGNSSITIPVNGLCGSLSFGYGLDDTSARSARVEFEVLVDGNSTFRSRPAGRARVRWREISVIGAQTIELRTRQTSSGNHSAQWIEPKLAW